MAESFATRQAYPAAGTPADIYTVPALTSFVKSSLVVCNQNNSPAKFRVSVAVAGAVEEPKQFLFYDQELPKRSTATIVIGTALAATDVLRVYSDIGGVSFNLSGVAIT